VTRRTLADTIGATANTFHLLQQELPGDVPPAAILNAAVTLVMGSGDAAALAGVAIAKPDRPKHGIYIEHQRTCLCAAKPLCVPHAGIAIHNAGPCEDHDHVDDLAYEPGPG
jgi:hypothetical protein